jgi:hypothetical protein
MESLLSRYRAGEHKQVWAELLALGEAIHEEPLFSEAYEVARETMSRVRTNVELLIPRLHSIGYKFGIYPDGSLPAYYSGEHVPPAPDIRGRIAALEGSIGAIPLSLRVFWEVVGSVDLTGYHPEWPEYSDPLIVYPIDGIDTEYDYWREACEENGPEEFGAFGIPIAPDVYHKDNVSGGPPYSIIVPNGTIDAKLEDERHETTFVDYLRICFRCGGFPGRGHLPLELSELTHSLLPI